MKIYLNSFKLVVHHLSERQKKSWGQKGVGHSGATEWEVLRIGAKAVAPGHVPLEAADFPWVTWSVPAAVLLPTPLFYPLPCGADRAAPYCCSLGEFSGQFSWWPLLLVGPHTSLVQQWHGGDSVPPCHRDDPAALQGQHILTPKCSRTHTLAQEYEQEVTWVLPRHAI